MVAVGVFAYVLGGRALWKVPLSFVLMMGAGFLLGIAQVDVPFVELGIALSSVVIGGVAALGRPTIAVGAAFDFHAGLLPQAPHWMHSPWISSELFSSSYQAVRMVPMPPV